ncbi:helix-turn-helix transcriptional regulator [Sinomicrobium soli]|uniref:helix-turn-helix transcriptional regulator n=1 Tax=Sinomicrobium sp. N-1-3-6 TaxID=2219864 RepID=UPI000DCC9188|nr:YafY family protein [Sinomicrobium sp. N-1-3-6]RAV29622.1 transcriptional regulator [Sinomicrobium sp. N-1-3-6]
MNRFDRITAILIQLQSRRVVRAQELAERFEVSLRTVYRDIRTLEEAGVPLYGEAGVGYSIVDGYRLPPVMFTREEAMAFVTAEKLMEQLTDRVIRKHFEEAMYKVRAVLRGSEKDFVEDLSSHIHVENVANPPRNVPENVLDVLFRAISQKKIVKMTYKAHGREEETERLIEPIGVYHEYHQWYTIAYCHLREDYRHFRADRIHNIMLTPRDRESEREAFRDYLQRKEQQVRVQEHTKIVIRVEKEVKAYLQYRRPYLGFVSEKEVGDMVEMTFFTSYKDNGFARWYIMFADYAEIVEPDELRENIREIVEKISARVLK